MGFMTDNKYNNYNRYKDESRARNLLSWTLGSIAIVAVVGLGAYYAFGLRTPFLASNNTNVGIQQGNPQVLSENTANPAYTEQGIELRTSLRKLWADHIFWTREFITSAAANTPNTTEITNRLMKNQEDIGNAVAAYYGVDAGSQLTNLLKQHIALVAELVNALKARNNAAVQNAQNRANANADAIATFLSSANPNWTQSEMSAMLREHVRILNDEANAQMQRNYAQSISLFDQAFDQAMEMADKLADGIIRQYPEKMNSSLNLNNILSPANPPSATSGSDATAPAAPGTSPAAPGMTPPASPAPSTAPTAPANQY